MDRSNSDGLEPNLFSVHLDTLPICLELLQALDTKIARNVRSELLKKQHNGALDVSFDPATFTGSVDLFSRNWLAVNLVSKYDGLTLGIDTQAAAIESFKRSEMKCFWTNDRLSHVFPKGTDLARVFHTAHRKIDTVLGDFHWDKVAPFFGFTSGASTQHRRGKSAPYFKFQAIPDVTRKAAILAFCAIESSPLWAREVRKNHGLDPWKWVNIVDGNCITTVPKNAKTDRVIAIEPDMNMYLQKGFGGYIRSKLKKLRVNGFRSCDLNDQTVNQQHALAASQTGLYATLDLKAASDTISIEVVRQLVPKAWFDAMDMVRSEVGQMPSGKSITYSKFSSMGNGFTFELESLIFWALTSAVAELFGSGDNRISIYGDDIICPVDIVNPLKEALEFSGFDLNLSKSFWFGGFRESCGKHYYHGCDVTPFYVRSPVIQPEDAYLLGNNIRRWSARAVPDLADPRLFKVWEKVVESVNAHCRFFVPDGIGDCGFIGTFAESTPRFIRRGRNSWLYDCPRLIVTLGKTRDTDDLYGWIVAASASQRARRFGALQDHTLVWDSSWEVCSSVPSVVLGDRVRRRVVRHRSSQWIDAPLWCID